MATTTKPVTTGPADGEQPKSPERSQPEAQDRKRPDRSPAEGEQRKRPERVFRVGSSWATIWCNELRQEAGPNEQTTRFIRSVNLERRFWNPKLKDGRGDWDSSSSYGLGDVHNAIAVLQLAAEHLKEVEADVTRE